MRNHSETPRRDIPKTAGGETPLGVMDSAYSAVRRREAHHLGFRYRSRALSAARAFQRFSPPVDRPRVLDLGAAEGLATLEVHRLLDAQESIGVEFSQDLIDSAGSLPEGVRLVQGDVTRSHESTEEQSFDLVTALAVLEHLDRPSDLLVQARHALKPGGVFVATCPSPFWDKVSGSLKLHQEELHQFDFDRKTFQRFAEQAGLEMLLYQRFMFVWVGLLPYLKISVSPVLADRIDAWLRMPRIFDLLFVNQLFVARAPAPA